MNQRRELLGIVLVGMLAGCSGTGPMTNSGSGEVESRGLAQMQRPVLPTFPQKFDVQGPESDSFGFAVTQPGPVVVDVQAQGAPVVVTLQGPASQSISQQGAAQVRLAYTVTPQDIQKGVLWGVQIRLAQPAPPQQGGRAGGSVMVQHPPVNQTVVQQAIQAMAAQQKQLSPQEQQQVSAQAAAQMDQAFQQRKAQFDRQQLDRRAALHAQIQPQLDQLRSRMSGQVRPRGVEGGEGTSAEAGASTEGEISTRALRGERLLTPLEKPPVINPVPVPQTSTSQQPITSAGSGPPPQQVMSNPTIASLSIGQGQPGDPVMIAGTGFSSGGEVHFIINPGRDVAARIDFWSDTQLFVSVPDATGIMGFNGQVYIVRAQDSVKSNLVPFRFNPALEQRMVGCNPITPDRLIQGEYQYTFLVKCVEHNGAGDWFGAKGNDEFFRTSKLRNGWMVAAVDVKPSYIYGASGAYDSGNRVGTDSPYVNVRWWRNGFSSVAYVFSVTIVGPKGVPDGVVVP